MTQIMIKRNKKNNKYIRLLSDTGIFTIGNLSQKLISFFMVPLYTSVLTTSEYGTSDLINSLTELLYPILTLSIYEAIFRFSISKESNSKKLLSNGFFIFILGSIFSLIIGVFVDNLFNFQYTWYLISILAAYSIRMIFAFFSRGIGQSKRFAASGVISAVTLCGANIILLCVLHMGVEGYLISLFISYLISALYLFFSSRLYEYINLTEVDFTYLKTMLAYSVPMIFHAISAWLINISGRYVILLYWGTGVVGLYSAAVKLPSIITTVSGIFSQAWQFNASLEYEKADKSDYYTNIFCLYSAILSLSTSFIIFILPFISKFMLKGEYYSAKMYLPLMFSTAMLTCYSTFFGAFYIALKKSRPLMYSTILSAGINIALCFLLVPQMGIWGSVIANNVSYIVIVVIRMIDISHYYVIKKDWEVIIPSLLIIGIQIFLMTFEKTHAFLVSGILFLAIVLLYGLFYKEKIKKIMALSL